MPKLIKNILVPTDFSDTSLHAIEAATKFAKKISGQIFLYHRIHLPPNWFEFTEDEKREHPHVIDEVEAMNEHIEEILNKNISSGIRINSLYSGGDLIKTIEQLVEDHDIDLVVMSSEGAVGLDEKLFGSNAQKICHEVDVPVLVVKHEVGSFFLKDVVFASEFDEAAVEPFENLIPLLQNFGSTIHLLHVASLKDFVLKNDMLERMQAFEELCWQLPCKIHGMAEQDVELAIQNFVNTHKTDLLCVVNHQKSKFNKLFKGSISENLINHMEGPVLSMPSAKPQLAKK